ncbi:MAG: two-component system sensor histidine kinase NtrB [Candidatus Brocadiia bacterium]
MPAKASSLRRDLFIAVLVLMTLVPLVVYFYAVERGKSLAAERLVEHVAQSVNRTLQVKNDIEAILRDPQAGLDAAARQMERVAVADDAVAYIQLTDREGNVLRSTSAAPQWERVAIRPDLPPAAPDIAAPELVRRLETAGGDVSPAYVVDLSLSAQTRGHMLVGMSAQALDEQLRQFQEPVRLSALQIAIICVAILAGFSAYIVYLSERTRGLHAQLQEESRLAYVGTLAASIAHEVRNPLSSVKMNVQMMENRLRQLPDDQQAQYFHNKIRRIQGEVDRLEDSVSHFLAFARPAPLRTERLRLSDVVDDSLELLQPQAQSKGVQLVRRYARDLPRVDVDPNQFGHVVQNLVLNAIQALDRGGTVTVATARGDGCVQLTVADDGPGIPEETQEKIFDVFFTTREGGTGLGLNIVSRIVDEHRGTLVVDSAPGEGTVFRIGLPLPDQSPEAHDES